MRSFPLLCGFFLVGSSLYGATATWNLNANGNWNVNANWTPATFPNAIDDVANFGNVITANRVISLGAAAQNITIGTLNIDDNNNYTIQSGLAGNTLIFDVSAGTAALNVTTVNGSGAHLITCPVTLNDTLVMSTTSASNLTMSGIITSAGAGLTKIGTGTGAWVLSAANAYTGATDIQAGNITYNINGAIPSASPVTIGTGTAVNSRLTLAAAMTVGNALGVTINSDGTLVQNSTVTTFLSSFQGSGTVNISTSGTAANLFNIALSSDMTFSGTMTGGASSSSTDPAAANRVTKQGTATLVLSGASTYSSRTFIADGVITAQNATALGIPGTNSTVYVRSTGGNVGSLYLENNITLAKSIRLNGVGFGSTGALRNLSGANTVLGTITIGWAGGAETASDATIQVDGTSLTVNGIMAGTSGLTKTGLGTLIYMGASNNTLTGLTTINAGTLELNKTAGINGLGGPATINAGGTLLMSAANQIVNTGVITLAGGTFNMAGFTDTIGSLVFNSGTLTQGGALLTLANATPTALSMSDATTITGNLAFSAAGGVTYTGTTTRALVSGDVSIGTTAHVFNIADGTDTVDMEFSGAVTGTTGTITKLTGTGTLLFSGTTANTYTGLTTVNAGTLQLGKTAGVNALNGSAAVNTGGTLQLLAADQIVNTAIVTLGGGTFNLGGNTETIASLVFNSGTLTQGGAVLTLGGATATTLSMSDGTTITGPLAFTAAGGVTYTGIATRATVSGDVNIGTTAHAFNIANGADTVDMEFSGAITGTTGTITKSTGLGTLLFSGTTANTYTGLTTVTTGELQLNKTPGVNAIAGNVTLNGGTLTLLAADQIANTSTLTLTTGTFNMGGFAETLGTFTYQGGTFTQGGATLSLASAVTALTMRNTTISGPIALTGGGAVVFDNTNNGTATLSSTIDLGGNTSIFNIAMGTATTDMLVSGVISNGALTKSGTGLLEFSGASANTYTGLTTVTAGTLLLNKTGVDAIAGNATVSGGILLLGSAGQIADTATLTISGGTFNMAGFGETVTDLIFNSGTLTQAGGTLTLTSASTALSMRNTTISGAVVLTGGGGVVFDSTSNGTAVLSGTVDLSGFTTLFTINNGTSANDMTVSGVISNGAVTKVGAGRLQYSGASPNTYTGLTTVTAGTLLLNKTAGVNAIAGDLLINGGIVDHAAANQFPSTSVLTITSGTFDLSGTAQTVASLTFQAGTYIPAGGVLTLASPTTALTMRDTTISGGIVLSGGGSVVFDNTNNGTATISGNIDLGTNPISFDIAMGTATTDMICSGIISNGSVTKIGTGQLQFSGTASNTYTGLTTVSAGSLFLIKTPGDTAISGDVLINGGTVSLGGTNQIANTSVVTLDSGTFNLGGFGDTIATFVYNGGTYTSGGATLSLADAVTALTMRDTTLAGAVAITGGGSVIFDSTNNGTATLTGTVDLGGANISFDIAEGTAATDMLINSVISNGGLTKTGAGTLVLAGANTYAGGTLVSAGTLQGDSSSLQGNITDNATLVFNETGTGTYAGMISGTGAFVKQGAGTLTLSNTNSVAGVATVSQGTLIVNGTLGGGNAMSVAPGAFLKGVGTITKDVTVNGTMIAGNSIGTLHLIGAQTLATGSTLEIELDPTTSDLIDIVGTLTIQPGVTLGLDPDPGMYVPLFSYTIVQTTGGVSGTFSSISNTFPLLSPTLIYTPTEILLEVAALPISTIIHGGNAGKVAQCLDSLSANPCQNLTSVIRALQMITSVESLKEALLQLQPSAFTSLSVVQENDLLYLTNAIDERLQHDLHSCCPSVFAQNERATAWVTMLAAHTEQKNQGGEPGFIANSPGIVAGIDSRFGSKIQSGIGLGYTHSHLHWREQRGESNMQTLYWTLYGKWAGKRAYLQAVLLGGYNFYTVDRKISFGERSVIRATAHSFHHGLEGSAHLKTGYRWGCRGFVFSPFASADYLYVHENGFHERGARSLNLDVEAKNSDLLVSEAGFDISRCFSAKSSTYTPYVQLSAIRESRFEGGEEKASLACGCNMTVKGLYPSRTLGSVKAGLNAEISRHTVSLSYQGKFSSHYQDQSIDLGYFLKF